MKLNLKAIEERVASLGGRDAYDREIIFELILAFGRSQGNVTRLWNGSLNVADDPSTEVAQKNRRRGSRSRRGVVSARCALIQP